MKNILPLLFSVIFLIFLINYCVVNPYIGNHQPAALAKSFLDGHLYITDPDHMFDTAEFNGFKYWPLGPFPALLITPFILLIDNYFIEDYLSFFITIITFIIIIKLSRNIGFNRKDSMYWALAFCVSTTYFFTSLVPNGWYFAHTVNSLLIFLLFYLFRHKKVNHLMIGILLGLILMTRLPSAIFALFFVIYIIFDSSIDSKTKIRQLSKLCIPLIVFIIILGIYNLARFDDFFNQGYSLQNMVNSKLKLARDDYGVLGIRHLPGNLYYMFLSMPIPVFINDATHVLRFPYMTFNPWGMSIFITSLWLFKIFTLKFRGRFEYLIISIVSLIALFILLFCGTGFWQIGYRYTLDFLPQLFFVFMIAYRREEGDLSNGMKFLISAGFILNIFLFTTRI